MTDDPGHSALLQAALQQVIQLGTELDEAEAECDELEEMLTAATDVAVQRGKRIDRIQARLREPGWIPDADGNDSRLADDVQHILDGPADWDWERLAGYGG